MTTVGWYDTGTSHDPGIQQEPAHQVPPCFEEAGAPRSVGDQLQRQQCFSAVLGHWSRSKLCHSLLELTFRTPSDGDPGILPAACFARTAHPNRAMLSSHERRYVTPLCLRSLIWGSCYRPSKPTKSNICLS